MGAVKRLLKIKNVFRSNEYYLVDLAPPLYISNSINQGQNSGMDLGASLAVLLYFNLAAPLWIDANKASAMIDRNIRVVNTGIFSSALTTLCTKFNM